jgi:O-antigen/teichoic acid export membrane protein
MVWVSTPRLRHLGINIIMMREIAQNPDDREKITSDFLGFRIIYCALIMALAPIVAAFIPQYSTIIIFGVAIAALAQLILLINQIFVSILQVSLELDRAVFAEVVNRALTLGLVVYGTQIHTTLEGFFYYVLWVTAAAAVVNAIISYWFARRKWRIGITFNWQRMKSIFYLVLPMGVVSFLGMVHFKSDTILLSLYKPEYDVGIYGYAYKIGEIMFSIPMMFIGIVFPRMSALLKQNKAEFLGFNQKIFEVLMVGTLPFIGGVYVLAPYLTTILSRQSVTDGVIAGGVLRILCFAMVAWFFNAHFQHILLAGQSYKGLIRNSIIVVTINVILNMLFIPLYSYHAAATITVTTELIMLVLTAVYVAGTTGFVPKLKGFVPVAIGTAGMVTFIHWGLTNTGLSPVTFAATSLTGQLLILTTMGLVGVVIYGLILLLWGKSSPIHGMAHLLRKK